MNKIRFTCLILILSFSPVGHCAGALDSEKMMFKGIDIKPIVEYYRPQVKTITRPVTIYNWAQGGSSEFWKTDRPQNDPELLELAKSSSEVFWDRYGDPNGHANMFGYGLYGAVDPVFTYGYGGASWLLMELRIPRGFRLINLLRAQEKKYDAQENTVKELLSRFECSTDNVSGFFAAGGVELTTSCQSLVRRIFKDLLKIDGFAYGYGSTQFKACKGAVPDSYSAFVITSSRWIRPGLVKYFTERTTSEIEARIRIQTLFLKEQDDSLNRNSALPFLKDFLMAHPTYYVEGSETKCESDSCVIKVHACESKTTCTDVDLPAIPRPGGPLITAIAARRSQFGKLLWTDLEGKPKATTIDRWLKQNKYGCNGTLPYPTENDSQP